MATVLSTITSTALLDGLRQPDDAEAWRGFVTRYQPVLRAFARRAGLGEGDVEDMVQETLTAFLESLRAGKYDRDRGRLRSWLRGIAFNKAREAFRRLGKREVQMVDDSDATLPLNRIPDEHQLTDVFEQEWQRGVLSECLKEARRHVDAQTFQAFELYALHDWPPAKVAEHLGVSRNVVYLSKNRVLSRLREIQKDVEEIW